MKKILFISLLSLATIASANAEKKEVDVVQEVPLR